MMTRYKDRYDAGKQLAQKLLKYRDDPATVVLGLPRGGVAVAFEVAATLKAPLDVFVVRKLGVPGHPELAMGALASGNIRIMNRDLVEHLNIGQSDIDAVVRAEKRELQQREKLYRGHRKPQPLEGRQVILVDDGLATGATMRAAIRAVQARNAANIIVAVPVASPASMKTIAAHVDDIVCPLQPPDFQAVGQWYEAFGQTTNAEVCGLIKRAQTDTLAHASVSA